MKPKIDIDPTIDKPRKLFVKWQMPKVLDVEDNINRKPSLEDIVACKMAKEIERDIKRRRR